MEECLPPNFSWVLEDQLAALAYPSKPSHLKYMLDQGIRWLVSLTEQVPPAAKACQGMNVVHIGIQDFTAPSMEQVEEFILLVEKAIKTQEAVAVHCAHGRGRTGTMIACYLVKALGYSAQTAISEIRHLRPGSIETHDQEELVQTYYLHISTKSQT